MPSHQDFGENALEVKKNPPATPPKLRREMGMCATTIYVQQQQQQYYTIRVLVVRTPVSSLLFQVQHAWYIRPGRHAAVAAARAAFATGAWVESKHGMYLIHTWKCGSSSFIFTHPPEDAKRKAKSIPGTWCGTCKHPTDYTNQRYGRLSCA